VLAKAEIRDDIYALVPLTHDKEIQDQVAGHVKAMSSPENGMWRIAACAPRSRTPRPSSSSSTTAAPTSWRHPEQRQFLDVELTDTAVAAGRPSARSTSATPSGWASTPTSTARSPTRNITIVSKESGYAPEVLAENPALGSTPLKIEIWRTLDDEGLAAEIGEKAACSPTAACRNVYPDQIESGGKVVQGYHLVRPSPA
jgi:hypothetical protein